MLYEQGGEALLTSLQALALPAEASVQTREELRKLIGYFENNRHRTDYPSYRRNGWDIGAAARLEAGCKIIGERLKGSGMLVEDGCAVTVASLLPFTSAAEKCGTALACQRRRGLNVTQVKDSHPFPPFRGAGAK